jgi:hypothetical protein
MIVCLRPNGLSATYGKRFITRHLAGQGGFATLATLEVQRNVASSMDLNQLDRDTMVWSALGQDSRSVAEINVFKKTLLTAC